MKIEKLTEANQKKVLTNHKQYATLSQSAASTANYLRVTKISQAVKNKNRANIFINDKFALSLNISQLADTKLKPGQTITESELAHLKSLSDFGKLYQRTLEWVLTRPRSISETRTYLLRKNAENPDQIIEKLTSKNYLNDPKFTQYYIENRNTKKGISTKRLTQELRAKGIPQQTITQALAATPRPESEEIQKVIAKKQKKYQNNPQKLIQYLTAQGFDYQLSATLVRETDSQN